MTTLQLTIICVTALAVVAIVARLVLAHDRQRSQLQRETAMHERTAGAPVVELAAATAALRDAASALLDHAAGRAAAPSRVGQRVTVHVEHPNEHTLFGVVVGDYADRLVLDDAEYVVAGSANRPLPGRQDIETAHIAWIDSHGVVARDRDQVAVVASEA